MEFIERHLDKPWNWNRLTKNDNITLKFIDKHIDKDWNWNIVSMGKFKNKREKINNFKIKYYYTLQKKILF